MHNVRFTKIGFKKSMHLEFVFEFGGTTLDTGMDSEDAPGAEFETAFQSLRENVIRLLGLSKTWLSDITITSLSISYNAKTKKRGLVITWEKQIERANSPWVAHTPHLLEPSEDSEANTGLTAEMIEKLDKITALAQLYLEGKTGQIDWLKEQARETEQQKPRRRSKKEQAELDRLDAARARRINAALLEVAPSLTTDRVLTDEYLIEQISKRWDAVEYVEFERTEGPGVMPGVLKHTFNDDDGAGVAWCFVDAAQVEEGGTFVTHLKFWFDIAPDLFDKAQVMPALQTAAIVSAYRELLSLPSPALALVQ